MSHDETEDTMRLDPGTDLAEPAPRGGRHPLHIGHLVMGLAFLGIALVWLLNQLDVMPNDDVRFLVPLPFLFAGALGLLALVLVGRRRDR